MAFWIEDLMQIVEPVNLTLDLPKLSTPAAPGGGFPLKPDVVENFAWAKDLFSSDELDAIIEMGKRIESTKASTGGGSDPKIRDSYVSFMFPNEITSWVFHRLANAVNGINEQFFGFDLTTMEQGLQFTRYAAPGEHYEWHIDRGMNHGIRKLSLTLQLSDPEDYEGGDLELWFGGEPVVASKDRGMVTFFPSYVMHRVKPVTKGVRYSLVCWVSGPSFK
jgi:PKHD-type hydroxylase